MAKIKNVIMIEPAGKGGICHYTYNLCQALGKKTHVTLLTASDYELVSLDKIFILSPLLNKFKTKLKNLVRAIRLIFTGDRIQHIQLSQHPLIVLLIILMLKMFGKKIIVTAHNVISHEIKKGTKIIFHLIYQASHAIIVHANNNKSEMLELFPIKQRKIYVIPHGNYMFFNLIGNNNQEMRLAGNKKAILFFGYIRPYKGLIDLIKSMPIILKRVPNAELIIAGRPVDHFDQYQRVIDKLKINDHVTKDLSYIPLNKVRKYYEMANVVAMPYKKIYQSGVLQLAYAFGVPVVATDTGGLPEVIENGKSGFTVPVGNIEKLAEGIIMILQDEILANRMGERAQEIANSKFSWDEIANQTIKVYNEIL